MDKSYIFITLIIEGEKQAEEKEKNGEGAGGKKEVMGRERRKRQSVPQPFHVIYYVRHHMFPLINLQKASIWRCLGLLCS